MPAGMQPLYTNGGGDPYAQYVNMPPGYGTPPQQGGAPPQQSAPAPSGAPGQFQDPLGNLQYSVAAPPQMNPDPNKMLRNEAQWNYNEGANQQQNLANTQQALNQNQSYYENLANTAGANLAATPGFTPQEQQNILRTNAYENLATTPSQYASLAPTQAETSGMTGNTNSYFNYLQPGANAMQGDVNQAQSSIQGVQGAQQAGYNQALNPGNLTLTPGFQQQYELSPQTQQQMINQAGENVGAQYASAIGDMQAQAAASGAMTPTAMGALRAQYMNQNAANASDAMNNAAINVNNAAAQRAMGYEQARLGANENLAGMQVGATGALANTGMQGAQYIGNLGTNVANNVMQTGTGIAETADQAAAQRAAMQYGIRQGNLQYGQQSAYNQGMGINSQLSNLNTNVGQQRIAGQNNYLGWASGQGNANLNAATQTQGQGIQAYGTQGGIQNQNAGIYAANKGNTGALATFGKISSGIGSLFGH